MTQEKRGGKREGAGRKKSPYETETIAFRVRAEFADEIRKFVKKYIDNFKEVKL